MVNSTRQQGTSISGYRWADASPNCAHEFLLPTVFRHLDRLKSRSARLLDLGCGNGAASALMAARGWEVVGVDPSDEGIAAAKRAYPNVAFHQGSAYEDLRAKLGTFPVVVSLEVVEHVYSPREYAARIFDVLEPNGTAILSTPYHGYLKNLALAVAGAMDRHFTALWDHGHIKFWSRRTLTELLNEAGLRVVTFERVGRIPPVAKSMILTVQRPG